MALARPGQNVGPIVTLIALDEVMILLALWAGGTANPGKYFPWLASTERS